jgi:hypothetical protein
VIKIDEMKEARERRLKERLKFRFVIDMATL